MPPGINAAWGERLASDLKRIREKHGVTTKEIYEATRLPPDLINEFEKTALFHHPQYSLVYIRSFVRSYAGIVGISPEHARNAIDAASKGRYAGSLGVIYLGDEPALLQEENVLEEAVPDEADTLKRGAEKSSIPFMFDRALDADKPVDVALKDEKVIEGDDQDKLTVSDPWYRSIRNYINRKIWLYVGGFLVIVVVIVGYFIINGSSSRNGSVADQAREIIPVEDSLALHPEEYVPPRKIIPPPGDTMTVHIYAANDKIQGIRVTVDDDLRRPYWCEQGDSLVYRITNQIILEEQLQQIMLTVEGENYPTNRVDSSGRLIITRDSVISYFDSLNL